MPNPGGAWASPVTPMCDFPAQNCNADAMALLGLLRVCGIEPTGDGLILAPQSPPERFTLDLPLLRLEVAPGRIAGEYRAIVDGQRSLHVRLPQEARNITARVSGQLLGVIPNEARAERPVGEVVLPLTLQKGRAVPFEVNYSRS